MEHNRHDSRIASVRKLTLVCIALCVAVMMVAVSVAGGMHAVARAMPRRPTVAVRSGLRTPIHSKYVEANGDGTYDLTLNVRGDAAEFSGREHRPADVVLVVDKSGSMNQQVDGTGKTRWQVVKHAATTLTRQLLTQGNERLPEAARTRMSLVLFDNTARCEVNWTTSADAITSAFVDFVDTKSTNWEDGLEKANELIRKGERSGVPKYVVFLTDGMPTYRMSRMGYTHDIQETRNGANGLPYKIKDEKRRLREENETVYGGTDSDYQDRCYNAAINKANERGNVTLFAVSAGGDVSNEKMQKFADRTGGQFFDGSNSDKLRDAFDTIVQQIVTTSWRYRDVTIMDGLSEYVTPVDGEHGPKYVSGAFDSRGKPVPKDADPALKAMNVSYDSATKVFKVAFDGGAKLTGGNTYWARLTIKPTDKAHEHYVTSGGKYPHTGDEGTDAPDKRTSSGQQGFHSNKGHATLTYRVASSTGGDEQASELQTAQYPRPVIQIRPATITLVGKVDNTYAGRHGAHASHWKLSAMDKRGAGIGLTTPSESVGMYGVDQMAMRGVLVAPGMYTLGQQADPASNYKHFSGYSKDGWTCTDDKGRASKLPENGQIAVGAGQNVTCTANFTAKPGKMVWRKVDESDTTKLLPGSHWSLSSTDVPGFESRNVTDNGEHDTDSADGRVALADLKWGEYKLTETRAPQGYQQVDGPLDVTVFPEAGEMAQEAFTVKAGDGGKVTNRKIAAKPAKPTTPAPKPAETPKQTAEPTKPAEPAKPAALASTGAWVTGGMAVIALGLTAAVAVRLARKWFMF